MGADTREAGSEDGVRTDPSGSPEVSIITTLRNPELSERPAHMALIQRNGLSSWCAFNPAPDLMVFGSVQPDLMESTGARVYPPGELSKKGGVPLITYIIDQGLLVARHDVVCYVNADIILMDDFLPAVAKCRETFEEYAMIGCRVDVSMSSRILFNGDDWQQRLRVLASGQRGYTGGADFFVMPRATWRKVLDGMADFYVGRPTWDTHLIWRLLMASVPVVDVTADVLAIHQKHKYNKGADQTQRHNWPDTAHNRRLAKGEERDIRHATWKLEKGKIVKHNSGL